MDQYSTPYGTEPEQPAWPYGYPPAPPQWPPPYSWEPTPPPSRRRSVLALLLLAVVMVGVGAGVAVAVNAITHGGSGSLATSISQTVVDVNSDLGNGETAAGTGIILSTGGQVLTNNHVIEGALHITVAIAGGSSTYQATVVGDDPTDDVAVLQLSNASGLSPATIGDSSRVNVGDNVTVVGNALGRGGPPTSSSGQVTALNQTITATDENGANPETLTGMIQFDAAIQPGDSGGPLLDSSNHVVGMDTAGSSQGRRQASNVGYAIPIDSAVAIAHQIASGSGGGNIQRGSGPLLGVDVQDSTVPPGALVIDVVSGTPADGAGIQAQDVITDINQTSVTSAASLKTALSSHHSGDSVTVHWVDDNGQAHQASVTLASAPPA
ncbi:MAG: trypsin-like peptidase domain-containing protein [Candidatus Dormibacteraeota bacterium]|nr:trypsin-like peptidase domain-containing protein [Candidatus Dormibacteraeota bacterium]